MKPYIISLIEDLKSINFYPAISKIILFGSHANNKSNLSSDVDLAIVCDEVLPRSQRGIIRSEIEELNHELDIDLFFTNVNNLKTENPKDTNYYIEREGVVIWQR